jgi:hypothetical protein
MQIVLVQSNEIREADFLKEVLEQLEQGRRKYPSQPPSIMFDVFCACVTHFMNCDMSTRHRNLIDIAVMVLRLATEIPDDLRATEDFFDDQFPELQMTLEEKLDHEGTTGRLSSDQHADFTAGKSNKERWKD